MMKTGTINLDKLGMTASLTCAAHCMAMPLVITALPYVGFSFIASEGFEIAFFIISAILAISSICWGIKQHKNKNILFLLSIGLALLTLGRYAHENDWGLKGVIILVAGGLTIAATHWINNKLCDSCKVCHH